MGSRSSKPVAPRSAWRGGFDSTRSRHGARVTPAPPWRSDVVEAGHAAASAKRRAGARARQGPAGRPEEPGAVVAVAREIVDAERKRLHADGATPADAEALAGDVVRRLDSFAGLVAPAVPAVINATGVIVHTNLGRAPWPAGTAAAVADLATRYQLLELDQATGRRGRRARIAEDHLVALTGAEDALVTNNNAAALALAVGLAGRGRAIVVSRGELVEIGGGVRIPDIIRRAGARLIEVGTTNRTRAADFEELLAGGRAGAVLRVHPSNFTMSGVHRDPRAGRRRRPGAPARGDRHRRPGFGGAPRHGCLWPDPRAAPGRTPGLRARTW